MPPSKKPSYTNKHFNKNRSPEMQNSRKQGGFTLMEIVIALALLSIMAALIGMKFDSSRAKAQALVTAMGELGNANERQKVDTGCFVNLPFALYDTTSAQNSANNYCARTYGSQWNGPYVTRFTADASGNATVDTVTANAVLSFGQEPGGPGTRYFVHATNIPDDVIKQAVQECNGSEDLTVTFDTAKCRASPGGTTGTFDLLYDETR
ncbi:type II secretion system protein [Paraburkholderia sp. UCT31]|uniref:type II secretion system protein n=1 Tax=Paraburkholderia sp. UCT31 TaxID=2615209 RepID=UPI001655F60F|nr:type II secretion system protein [Paraburkholderia sp. UCT31]MBC8738472.1 type II secretion system protein [Paraburkholderia sp. UCT31]